jgi:hypothetical protein
LSRRVCTIDFERDGNSFITLGSFNLKEGKNMATPLTNSIGSRC